MNNTTRCIALILAASSISAALAGGPTPAELQSKDRWAASHLLVPKGEDASDAAVPAERLPFGFVFGEKSSDELFAAWPLERQSRGLPGGRTQHVLTWKDPASNLEVRCVAVDYSDFPALEWTLYFKNSGSQDTPLLENIQAIDVRLEREAEGEYVLRGHRGDTSAANLYEPLEYVLAPGVSQRFAPVGGRGTNHAFPYYNLAQARGEQAIEGLILAVGWPGQWSASFIRDEQRGLQITAGQELTHLVLRPGEEIRSPLIALLFWQGGDVQRSQNLWRRWMIAHNLPRTSDGKLPPPIMPGNTSLQFNEMCNASEESQKYFIDRYVQERVGIDYWWMDAGWYPCDGWPQTGTWEPDLKRFPGGLRSISDHARAKGIKTLVWFEPERVAGGTWLADNHPEWLLGGRLLNLGNPAARQWLTDHVDRLLSEQGIDLYRQDFNMDPLHDWRHNDPPDRQGMTENLHVQGYLAYWDALRQRHPNLIIDSCASGGRRNDLETMRRAVPLHPTDYNYTHLAAKQAFHHSLFQWLPYFGSNTMPIDSVDAYGFRSGHAMGVVLGYDMRRQDLDYDLLRKLTAEVPSVTRYYYGDYYPLTPYSLAEDAWIAWQFHQSETNEGVVEVFRRPRSPETQMALPLRGLDSAAVYQWQSTDEQLARRARGSDLAQAGLPVNLARRPQAATILYRRLETLAAVIDAPPEAFEAGQPVDFSGQGSFTPGGEIASYQWDFGDGDSTSGASAEHAYRSPGTYRVKLTIADGQGRTDATAVTVTARPVDTVAPEIVAVASGDPQRVTIVFSEPVEPTSAETAANYSIDHGIEVRSAQLERDRITVTLEVSPLSPQVEYHLTARNVTDRARTPHSLAEQSPRPFRCSGLYGWWKLSDGRGDMAIDLSGNGHHGLLSNGAAWAESDRGTVLSLDGVDDYVDTGSYLPDLNVPLTIALWVKPADTQVIHADILGNHGEPYVGINLQQDGTATNSFGFGYGDGKRWQGTGSAQLEADQWQHLAVVCDGQDAILYVDGAERCRAAAVGPIAPNPAQNFKLGQGYHSGRYFRGLLSDVRIYRRALSAAEVRGQSGHQAAAKD